MSMQTNLQGRLRNTDLPKSQGLLPVIEAVVNSIHSLEEKENLITTGKIVLTIERDSSLSPLDYDSNPKDIVGFIIEDNGIGFNDNNLYSFNELDSEYKVDKGCRGVGRLLWLKAFSRVDISSEFQDSEHNSKKRTFSFDSKNGTSQVEEITISSDELKTLVHLQGFNKKYRDAIQKTIEPIARSLLEHCLWYFVRPQGFPEIIVQDNNQTIKLSELYDECMHESAYIENIKINEYDFDLTHIKFRASSNKKHNMSLCAGGHLVLEKDINGLIPGLFGKLNDNKGEFLYSCYVSSAYLDERVRPERTAFNITEQNVENLLSELSIKEIRDHVLERSMDYLKTYLEQNISEGKCRLNKFVSEKAPRYRPIIQRINEKELSIDPAISDKDLELHLHTQLAIFERNMLRQGHEI